MSENNDRSDKVVWRAAPTARRAEATVKRPPHPPVAVPRPPWLASAPPHRRRNLLGCLGLPILLSLCLLLAGAGYFFYALNRPLPTLPLVTLSQPRSGDRIILNTPVLVSASAEDPDGIAQAELWVNGGLVAAQANLGPADTEPFQISQAWRPTEVGSYLALIRASDRQGFVGQSRPLLIEVVEKPEPNPDAVAELVAQPGDTVESIGAEIGVAPEQIRALNPDLDGGEPAPDEPIFVPSIPDSAPSAGGAGGGGEPSGIPEVGLPAEPPIPPEGSGPTATPEMPPFYSGLGRLCFVIPSLCADAGGEPIVPGGHVECAVRPELCAASIPPGDLPMPDWARDLCAASPGRLGCLDEISPGLLPPAAPRISARYDETCQVEVYWTDESDNEVGFKVYRLPGGASGDLIALTDSAGSFLDSPAAGGVYRYYAAAYNSAGETPGAPTGEIIVPASDCLDAAGSLAPLELDALQMTLSESMDRMYCYYSVAGSPYTRVPGDEALFMELGAGGWNIAEYAGGRNRLRFSVPFDAPLEVAGECLGWRGDELVNLGGFRQSHPAEEWDGRTLSAGSGLFTVTYKIQPPTPETSGAAADGELERAGVPMPIVDPSIPPPYNLRRGAFTAFADCGTRGTSGGGCAVEEGSGLQWDWEPAPGDSRRLVGFDVYYRLAGLHDGVPAGAGFGRVGDVVRPRQRYYWTYGEKRAPGAFSASMPCAINTRAPLESLDLGRARDPSSGLVLPPNLDTLLDGVVVAQDVYYSVQAVVTDGYGGRLESPLSEKHWVGLSGCPYLLVVRLDNLWFYDGTPCEVYREGRDDDAADVYGWIEVDGSRFYWNCPYCDNPASYAASWEGSAPPHDTGIRCEGRDGIQWGNEILSLEGPDGSVSGFSRGNIMALAPLRAPYDSLTVGFAFYDYDSGLRFGDDLWCAERQEIRPETGWGEAVGGMTWFVESRGEYDTDYDITCSIELTTYFLEFLP